MKRYDGATAGARADPRAPRDPEHAPPEPESNLHQRALGVTDRATVVAASVRRRDELDRANDVVINLLDLIGRYPLLATRRSTNLGASATSRRTTNRREDAARERSHFSSLHIPISSDSIERRH